MVVVKEKEVLKLRGASSQSTNRIRASREPLNKSARRVIYSVVRQPVPLSNLPTCTVEEVRIPSRETVCPDVVRNASSSSSPFSSPLPSSLPFLGLFVGDAVDSPPFATYDLELADGVLVGDNVVLRR